MFCKTFVVGSTLGSMFWIGWRPPSIGSMDNADPAHPVRCHWQYEADRSRCEDVLVYMENAWRAQVDDIGFAPPAFDEDNRVDVYLTDYETYGGAWTYADWIDADPKDGRMGAAAYMAIDPLVSDADMESFVAHEFNHVLQYATDYLEPSLPIWEGVATAAQKWTMGTDDPWDAYYMKDFQAIPWMGLLGDGYIAWYGYGVWSYYEYGSLAWIRHLDHHHGDDQGAAGAALWWAATQESPPNEPDVIDAYDAVTGDWRDALMSLSEERVRMGTDYAPAWQGTDGVGLRVARAATVDWSELPVEIEPEYPPFQTGAVYVEVTGVPAGEAVAMTIDSAAPIDWGVVAVEEDLGRTDRSTHINWVSEGGWIVLGAVHLGGADFDGDDALQPAELSLHVDVGEAPPEDTGPADTGPTDTVDTAPPGETGPPGDTEETDSEPGTEPEDTATPPVEEEEKGWGCATTHPAGLAWLLAAAALARRGRSRAGEPTWSAGG